MTLAPSPPQYGLDRESVWPAIGYVPHKGQRVIHRSPARHRVAACGRRFGKSTLGGNELVPEALLTYTMRRQLEDEARRREFWIVGPEYSDSEKEFRVVFNALKKLEVPFDRPGTYNNPESGDLAISLWNGIYKVHAKSAKYPGTLVGEGLAGVILAEAAKLKELVWVKYLRPTLADVKGWSLHTSTPEGKNWFYRLWQRGIDPNARAWAAWRMPAWRNDVVFPMGATTAGLNAIREALRIKRLTKTIVANSGVDPEIIDMMLDMSEEKFNQEIGADFTEFVGRVFKDFDEEVHVKSLQYNPRWPLYACCDYGWTNPFVWLFVQVDVWDNIYVIGEYRCTQRDINDISRDLATHPLISNVRRFYPDPAEPGDTAVLSKALRIPANTSTGGELKWRLELTRQHLRLVPETAPFESRAPRLLIDRSCTGLIQEMNDYRYPDTKEESVRAAPETPMDKDDHGPEALGRFMRGYFGGPSIGPGKEHARVRRANLGGRAA
jgi:hypothetical protein